MITVLTAYKMRNSLMLPLVSAILTSLIMQLILKQETTFEGIHLINHRKANLIKTLFKIPKIILKRFPHRIISRDQTTLFHTLV